MTRLPPAQQPTEPLPFLGRYQLQKKIAVGGMAELYLAHASGAGGFKKQVVVKRILPQLAESEELFQMFLDEARIAATLQHANIVQVYDACEDEGEFFIAMEYLDGTDLRTLRRVLATSNMAIGWEHSLHIVGSIASGLHYAHEKCAFDGTPLRIVHRDVSPQNIFLTREGSVKLVDFGIAKAEGRTTETAVGTLKGKLAYMAPEQCASEHVDHRADIYSLGVILYELTTGRRLYSSKTEYQLIKEIVEGKIRVPSTFMDYPAELERIVLTCLEKDPEERYESARDIQADLNVFARDYQLICSTLGFSIFIEPLLEQARVDAEERWQHRKEIRPIRIKGSQVGATPDAAAPTTLREHWIPDFEARDTPAPRARAAQAIGSAASAAPRTSTAAPPPADRADEIIDDFLSAKQRPALRRSPRATSTPLAIDTRYMSRERNALEDLTRPVPANMLERIRQEERERMQSSDQAGEHDAVPRIARGSMSGELSVSTHVVRRETGRSVILPESLLAEEREARAAEGREAASDFVDIRAGKVVHLKTPSPQLHPARAADLPVAAAEARMATALVAPGAFAEISEADLCIRPKRSKLWSGAGVLAGAGIAAALLLGDPSQGTRGDAPPIQIEKPALGALTVQATAEARVWLLLGKTPLQDMSVHGQESILVRIEHEGYQSRETHLGPQTWQRDAEGVRFAAADIHLQPQQSAEPLSPGDEAEQSAGDDAEQSAGDDAGQSAGDEAGSGAGDEAGSGAQRLRLDSTPSAANAWLYVGTTPNVTISRLKTGLPVELRVEQEGQLPLYRSVAADSFDDDGRASLHLILPASMPASRLPAATLATPGPGQETDGARALTNAEAPQKKWRPKRKTTAPARAKTAEPIKATAAPNKLQPPIPDWAK